MSGYQREFAKLNQAQRLAVETIDGPVMVIAGPGTGKTQLLTMRVANILLKTDIYPDNILCLTFTNKAADNMAERLLKLIGRDAQAVTIKTFHGLAAEIMNRYPEYFWHGARLAIAPDAIQLEIMQRVLTKLPPEHELSLKFAGQFTLIDDVTRAVNLAKEAGLTPAKLRAVIAANLAYLDTIEPELAKLGDLTVSHKTISKIGEIVESLPPQPIDELIAPLRSLQVVIQDSFELAMAEVEETGKATPISKWKSRWLQRVDGKVGMSNERKRNEWWLSVADAYQDYRYQLHKRGYYDYADMLVEVISQIESHQDLRAQLQEQFHYVLIDEFQDTNAAQLRLAHLIADNPAFDNPNLMAVGDDDQSIFKFQGAELSNMLGFKRQYQKAKLIVLEDNYRSNQILLDNAGSIIAQARYRLVTRLPKLSKRLRAANPPPAKGQVAHRIYHSREEQLDDLANQAKQLFRAGQSVAILARHHSSLRDMAMILQQKNVPLSYEQSNSVLEQPAIQQLCLILGVIAAIRKGQVSRVNELLSRSLRHPMWQISPRSLWKFASAQQTKHDWFSGLAETKDKRLAAIGQWLDWLTEVNASEPLAVTVEYALGLRGSALLASPLKSYFFANHMTDEAYIETLSAVQLLRQLVAEFHPTATPKVDDFVEFVELMANNNKVITDSSPFVSGEKYVELLSVHKAKGLEFDAVIIIDAVKGEWMPRKRGRVPPANLPLRPAEDDEDDYVRLMYVAATRARHTLIFGSYQLSHIGESVQPALSISEIATDLQKPQPPKKVIKILEQSLLWPRLQQPDERMLLKPRLETFVMNVSNLINFLDVTKGGPRYFKERNLLRLPEAKSPSAAMGSAVHAALQEAQLRVNVGTLKLRPVLEIFDKALLNEGLPEVDYKKKLAEGRHLLTTFIEKQTWEFIKGARPEYQITEVSYGQTKLGGTLDVLHHSDELTLISDYKTGRPLTSLSLKSGSDGVRAWRHKLQMVFYALLVEIDPAIRAEGELISQMVYVQSKTKTTPVLQYKPNTEETARLGALINAVWLHIMDLNFPDISNYSLDLKGVRAFEDDLIGGRV